MTTILLIRHGENDMVGKRLAGRLPNVHLNDNGRKQADEVAQALRSAPIKAIYSSPLERAVETAQPLADALGLPVQMAPGIIELAYGDWTGKTLKQLSHYKLWKLVQDQPSQMRFPNGESFVEVQQRALAEIERISAQHEEHDLLAFFSHGDIIRLLMAYYLATPLDEFQRVGANPASISVVHLPKKGRPHVAHLNLVLSLDFKADKADPAGGKVAAEAGDKAAAEAGDKVAAGAGDKVAAGARKTNLSTEDNGAKPRRTRGRASGPTEAV